MNLYAVSYLKSVSIYDSLRKGDRLEEFRWTWQMIWETSNWIMTRIYNLTTSFKNWLKKGASQCVTRKMKQFGNTVINAFEKECTSFSIQTDNRKRLWSSSWFLHQPVYRKHDETNSWIRMFNQGWSPVIYALT